MFPAQQRFNAVELRRSVDRQHGLIDHLELSAADRPLQVQFGVAAALHRLGHFRTEDHRARAARLLGPRSEEHTSELQSLMRISYAVFCLKKKTNNTHTQRDIVAQCKKTDMIVQITSDTYTSSPSSGVTE